MNDRQLQKIVEVYLEDSSLEEFLEQFDITPFEAVKYLYEGGYIDEETLKSQLPTDA